MRTRYLLVLPLSVFAITLGIVVGERMSHEAMIVVIGVVAGIAASLPTSLLTVWLVSRRQTPPVATPTPAPRPAPAEEPRIIVVQAPAAAPNSTATSTYPDLAHEPRYFNIIGDPDQSI
jgi:hypothetical protein